MLEKTDLHLNPSRSMPDIALSQSAQIGGRLDRVGMGKIECMVRVNIGGQPALLPAEVDAYVSLDDPKAKGIHMSRMYTLVTSKLETNELSFELLTETLNGILESHQGLSEESFVAVRFRYPLKRRALVSDNHGLRHYPVSITAKRVKGKTLFDVECEILYSSTCPCSAALARQLIQKRFSEDFAGAPVSFEQVHDWLGKQESILATPHSQRSRAEVLLSYEHTLSAHFPIVELIDAAEDALATPVQSVVKREDEQEFALLNGTNPMFCEDAARRLKREFSTWEKLSDFHIRVTHEESLHPHDAVAWASKDSN